RSVPLLSQTQMAYLTVVRGSTELTLFRVWILRHKVPGGGVGVVVGVAVGVEVGVAVGVEVGVVVGVVVGVAFADLFVPPGVIWFESVLCAGTGCGSVAVGGAGAAGRGCGRGALSLG